MTTQTTAGTALITGGSRGLGRALTSQLVAGGWHVVIDGRDAGVLAAAAAATAAPERVVAIAGDVADPAHRERLVAAVSGLGRLDLLVNNASTLGPIPLPTLAEAPVDGLREVLEINAIAPLVLIQSLLPVLRRGSGRIINVSSDAAVQGYPGWGLYGAAKAALDQLSAVLAAEEPTLRVYAVDPGDMATELHRAADPEADPAELLAPEAVAPRLLPLVRGELPSGRYLAADLIAGPIADPSGHPAEGLPADVSGHPGTGLPADVAAAPIGDVPADPSGHPAADLPAHRSGHPARELPPEPPGNVRGDLPRGLPAAVVPDQPESAGSRA